jgi:hypothetical protein
MRIMQLVLVGLPVVALLVTVPAMAAPFNGSSLRSFSGADRMIHEVGYRSYYHRYGYRYGAHRCQNSPAEC